jgi:hypothetical protein
MTTIQTYLYPNIVQVQIMDTAHFTTRNRVVYARPVTVYQGTNNPIQVVIKNQDQKPVNLTGYSVQAEIQDPAEQVTVHTMPVSFAANIGGNIAIGRGSFTINTATVNSLDQRLYKLTFKTIRTADNLDTPLYIDDNFGVPLDLQVQPAYYNEAAVLATPGTEITIDGGTI